ncbi:hypothetical protein B0H11DRAFT_2276579 [Mycena galericulata]|nr:hypothetical protein B0H11DRAFT_2276579 [Mycena galericulata]
MSREGVLASFAVQACPGADWTTNQAGVRDAVASASARRVLERRASHSARRGVDDGPSTAEGAPDVFRGSNESGIHWSPCRRVKGEASRRCGDPPRCTSQESMMAIPPSAAPDVFRGPNGSGTHWSTVDEADRLVGAVILYNVMWRSSLPAASLRRRYQDSPREPWIHRPRLQDFKTSRPQGSWGWARNPRAPLSLGPQA